ncbi:MAG: ribonuclease III [Candidatus Methylacidiphilales bacterium]|nr:ribonuclease III [Candidatus Methylacidiphilales bacterium]
MKTDPPNLDPLQEALGYRFQDASLLRMALTHPSVRHEAPRRGMDNQRLEFLGDAVLQLALSEMLYKKFPRWDEGRLTRLRARLVNRTALETVAKRYDLGNHLILGRGELKNQGRSRSSNLADAFEAVLGAIFLDGGYSLALAWIEASLSAWIEAEARAPDDFNAKGALQEWLQASGKTTPEYQLLEESGPDHEKQYVVSCRSEGLEIGRGTGTSKKAAEASSAANALENLKGLPMP